MSAQTTFTIPVKEYYTQQVISDAEDFLADNGILKTPATLAAAAFLLSEQY
jgi:hypothetical protein